MFGGGHFQKKIDKKALKKSAKKENAANAKKGVSGGQNKATASAASVKSKNYSHIKGSIVAYDTHASRDSANDRRNVPFQNKATERAYKKAKRIPSTHNVVDPAAGNGARRGGASSAAQRRQVLRRKGDDDLLSHFKEKLNASTFRLLNEQIYNSPNAYAGQLLRDRPTFLDYHTGYRQQLVQWPMNPNQLIVECLLGDRRGKFMNNKGKCLPGHIPPNWVIADMGCGDAQIAAALQPKGYTVHSFDFCALNERVTEADAAHVPLERESVDICIFSLSLMATDYEKCLMEAFRILKPRRLLKIVEVRSRIPHPRRFAAMVESIGFTLDYNDVAGDYFAVFDLVKRDDVKEANQDLAYNPSDVLVPSLYKKR